MVKRTNTFRENIIYFESYLSLENQYYFNDHIPNLNFKRSIHSFSFSSNKYIFKLWNKYGFKSLFKDLILFNYLQAKFCLLMNNNIIMNTFFSKKGEEFKRLSYYCENLTEFSEIKLSKKTGRAIGFVKGNDDWFDLANELNPFKLCDLTESRVCFRFVHLDKDPRNLSITNLIPVPKNMTYKNAYEATHCLPQFKLFPDIEEKLTSLSSRESYTFMLSQPDKVWLNHNIVCIVMDNFVVSFIRNVETRITGFNEEWIPNKKSHYFMCLTLMQENLGFIQL